MTIERIEELVGLLPAEAAYLARIPRPLSVRGFPPETDIYAHVCNDPRFGWRFIQSFLELDRPLPAQVYQWQLVRPHCYLRSNSRFRSRRCSPRLSSRSRRWQSRLPADLLNPAGLELERVLPSLTKSRCPLRFQPKLQHFKWRADGAAVGMVTWNCPATAATPPVTPVVHRENRSSP